MESALSECDNKGTYSSFGGAIREHNRRFYRNLLKPIIKMLIETEADRQEGFRISTFFFIRGIIIATASISILYCFGTAI
ncbi:hypothetical protein [Eubacterium ruminantium]|uniref:hypothetical protein n=1 Tax=Eubacterium ruminantium TaxID=42322 RepID=UPI00247B05D1|nr:hypothetical protein [Eubacterium ruminantium]